MSYAANVIFICSLAFLVLSQRQPTNITRADGETNVFIPCPFEFRATPSIWRIRGVDYTAATISSIYYSITPVGLFINTVHVCMNQTSFQCIDTSDNALEEQLSNVGILTVTSQDNCTDDEFDYIFAEQIPQLELDHRLIQYGSINTTLVWKTVPIEFDCSRTRILSYRTCEQNNIFLNHTTEDEMVTLPTASFQQSGELIDFSLSSQPLEECPSLMDMLRFNVTETETVSLLLGNNNCTCIDVERRGGLSFAVSNPAADQVDIVCRVRGTGSYNPVTCNRFSDSGLVPFFNLYNNPLGNSYTLCFGNISKQLNGSRFELFAVRAARCPSTPSYTAREYFRSFELSVARASASISVNVTTREICFTSSNNCSLTDLTQYDVSIVDISGNALFERGNIPESTCQVVSQLELLPQCGPFLISTQPVNEYIIYSLDVQQITLDTQLPGDEPKLCSCLKASTRLELATFYDPQTSTINVNSQCWTVYTTPVNITLSGENGTSQMQTTCSNRTFKLMVIDRNRCDYEFRICGNFAFTNGSDCALNCSDPIMIPCPTTTTIGPGPRPPIGVIIGSVVSGVLVVCLLVVVLVVMLYFTVPRCGHYRVSIGAQLRTTSGGTSGEGTSGEGTSGEGTGGGGEQEEHIPPVEDHDDADATA